jgi:hypothetical protein
MRSSRHLDLKHGTVGRRPHARAVGALPSRTGSGACHSGRKACLAADPWVPHAPARNLLRTKKIARTNGMRRDTDDGRYATGLTDSSPWNGLIETPHGTEGAKQRSIFLAHCDSGTMPKWHLFYDANS